MTGLLNKRLYLAHRYRKYLNRLLKVCYVPATSAVLIAFFSSFFLLPPLTVLMKQTRQPVHVVKESIYLDAYDLVAALVVTIVTYLVTTSQRLKASVFC